MLNKKNVAENWKKVVEIYNSTRETDPNITAKEIVNQIGYEQTVETFAVVAAIKKYDGRIYGKNRDWMNQISVDPEAVVRERENPVYYAGLDDIHTTHINQIITALQNMKEV